MSRPSAIPPAASMAAPSSPASPPSPPARRTDGYPEEHRDRRPGRHQGQRRRHAVDGGSFPDLSPHAAGTLTHPRTAPNHEGLRRRRGAAWSRFRTLCRRDPWSRWRERRGKSTLMKIIAGVHTEFSGVSCSMDGISGFDRLATRVPPASRWFIRNSAWRPICRWPRTCFSAPSRPTASGWCSGGGWPAKRASNSRGSASTSIRRRGSATFRSASSN